MKVTVSCTNGALQCRLARCQSFLRAALRYLAVHCWYLSAVQQFVIWYQRSAASSINTRIYSSWLTSVAKPNVFLRWRSENSAVLPSYMTCGAGNSRTVDCGLWRLEGYGSPGETTINLSSPNYLALPLVRWLCREPIPVSPSSPFTPSEPGSCRVLRRFSRAVASS